MALRLASNRRDGNDYSRYQTDLIGYCREQLGFAPWESETDGEPGQGDLFRAIEESARLQLAGDESAFRWIAAPAAHTVGKTYGAAAVVNWFFDAFPNSICYTTAPTSKQVELLLWKNIRTIRPSHLPGTVLPVEPKMSKSGKWFAVGFTTTDAGGKGGERFQGQHDKFLLVILDEAEGVPDFVFKAVQSMISGGVVVLCLMLGNPKTRTSTFYKQTAKSNVLTIRLDGRYHPNVIHGDNRIPGGLTRRAVEEYVAELAEECEAHNEDEQTFVLPWRPGVIYRPLPGGEVLWRVMGLAPSNVTGKMLVSVGRYQAACSLKRATDYLQEDPTFAAIGVDVARFGDDFGTAYERRGGRVRRIYKWIGDDTTRYHGNLRDHAKALHADGVRRLQIRVDDGGGYGSGVIDPLRHDLELLELFGDGFEVFGVQNGGTPKDERAYADVITELYAHAGESLKGIYVEHPPPELEQDLTERRFDYFNKGGLSVKRLEPKKEFKKPTRVGRSPDDGDGFVLAVAPGFLFETPMPRVTVLG